MKLIRARGPMSHPDTAVEPYIRGDFHSHILPEMDDGASNSNISVDMLLQLKQQNVDLSCLTPHYSHHRESIKNFLTRRTESYHKLMQTLHDRGLENTVPYIKLGAEVRVETGLLDEPDLQKLCYTGTNALLLEFPFSKLERRIYETVENIVLKYRVTPVIAHFERYSAFYSQDDRERILSLPNVIIQVNSETLQHFTGKKFVFSLVSQGIPVILGSDAHDMKQRPPDIETAYSKMEGKMTSCEKANLYRIIKDTLTCDICI